MKLIERYIFKRAGLATAIILGSLVGVIWVIQALKELDVITTKGQTIISYLALTTLAIPMLVVAVIPIALLLATVFTVNTMNGNSELVVVNASGASSWTLAKPLLILALFCSLLTGLVGHYISPLSRLYLKIFATEMRADLVQIVVREGTFTRVQDGLYFHIADREAGGILSGILISDEREAGKSVIFTANKGYVRRVDNGALLLLRDGEIQQRNAGDEAVTVIRYDSYVFDLSTLAGKIDIGDIRPKERTSTQLLNPDPNDIYFRDRPGLYRSQLHERFSEMLWPFTFVAVMLAFAGQAKSNRQSHGSAIGTGMLVVTFLRGLGFSAVNALEGNGSAIILVYLLPLSGIAFGGWFLLTNRPVALPVRMHARIDSIMLALAQRREELVTRYLRRRHAAGAGA
jgi:lipopolysaccharide export system permease protein